MSDILIIEDELSINELIKRNLSLVGHSCTQAYDGPSAIARLGIQRYDLVILDIMLPGSDGFQIYRQFPDIPVIFLTARGGLEDKLQGLTMGAMDYMTKPFEMLELLARVENVLRRNSRKEQFFAFKGVCVDFESRQVTRFSQPVECTPKEYALLETLIRNRNIALSRSRLLELVWGYDFVGDTRTVDVHIQKLRKKLQWEQYIVTVYKLGYRLEVTP